MIEEVSGGQITDQRLVDLGRFEVELLQFLCQCSLAIVIWYLIERACFSRISAASRSPMICWGSCWRLTAVAMISS